MGLKEDMKEVVDYIERLVKQEMETSATKHMVDHHYICTTIAGIYDLFENDMFPIWLSRIVEGVMRDV